MIEDFLKYEIKRLSLPGLAVTITRQSEEYYSQGFGYCDPTEIRCINPDTLFGVASVTKLVTTLAILRLQEQGHLSVNDPVSHYFPDLQIVSDQQIKLHHLLSHSAGLPGLSSRFLAKNLADESDTGGGSAANNSINYQTKIADKRALHNPIDLVEFLNNQEIQPIATPGELLNYCNEGYCLLGGIIEMLTGVSYQDHVKNTLFLPLEMHDSLIGNPSTANGNIALPLEINQSGKQVAGIWDAPLFYPVGGMISSARDLCRLVNVLSGNSSIISSNSIEELSRSTIGVSSRPDKTIGYSFGLEYQALDNDSVLLWHTGQRQGISSFVAYLTGTDISVSVLSHVANAPVAGVGFGLIARVLNNKNIVWPQLSNLQSPDSFSGLTPSTIILLGQYASKEGFNYRVSKQGERYFLHSGDSNPAVPLIFIDKLYGIAGNQNFRFLLHTPSDSKPWALALDLRILPRVD